jgi:hypothetical protein
VALLSADAAGMMLVEPVATTGRRHRPGIVERELDPDAVLEP